MCVCELNPVSSSLQGLRVECVGMQMHLVNKMGEPDSPDERFVDVFAGGALLTRYAAEPRCTPCLYGANFVNGPRFEIVNIRHEGAGQAPALMQVPVGQGWPACLPQASAAPDEKH